MKCIRGKYTYIEAIQIASRSGIYKTNIYHNDCYLGLFCFQISYDQLLFFWNKRLALISANLQ